MKTSLRSFLFCRWGTALRIIFAPGIKFHFPKADIVRIAFNRHAPKMVLHKKGLIAALICLDRLGFLLSYADKSRLFAVRALMRDFTWRSVPDLCKSSGLEPVQLGHGSYVFGGDLGTCVHRSPKRRLRVRSISFNNMPLAKVELCFTLFLWRRCSFERRCR